MRRLLAGLVGIAVVAGALAWLAQGVAVGEDPGPYVESSFQAEIAGRVSPGQLELAPHAVQPLAALPKYEDFEGPWPNGWQLLANDGPTIRIEGKEIVTSGSEVTRLSALGISEPPLCGFTIDVVYNPLVKDATDCDADPGSNFDAALCNVDYAADTVRVTGGIGTEAGLTGDIPLADITWEGGDTAGCTDLTLTVVSLVDCQTPPQAMSYTLDDPPAENCVVTPEVTPTPCPMCGDVNCDNTVDAVDAMFILQYVVGLRGELCVPCCPGP